MSSERSIIKPFWRDEPFTKDELELLLALNAAHAESAERSNASTSVLMTCAAASHDYVKAVAGALMTLGGSHAPIQATMLLLNQEVPDGMLKNIFALGSKVPGWGNSFVKGQPDPIWEHVDKLLAERFPLMHDRIVRITRDIQDTYGKKIFPNPSTYTAAAALIFGLPAPLAIYLLIAARLESWTQLVWRQSYGKI